MRIRSPESNFRQSALYTRFISLQHGSAKSEFLSGTDDLEGFGSNCVEPPSEGVREVGTMLRNQVPPELAEWIDSPVPGDLDFYAQYARSANGSVLVLMSGTGRFAFALARAGAPVMGIDPEESNVEWARAKTPPGSGLKLLFFQADPTHFIAEQKHSLVIIPGGALQRLLTQDEQRNCLLAVRRAMALGGTLLLDMPLWDPSTGLTEGPVLRRGGRDEPSVLVSRQRRFEPVRQTLETLHMVEWLDDEGVVTKRQAVQTMERYSTPSELLLLLQSTGFAPTCYGSFDRTGFVPGAKRLVIEATMR
jgi:SAM-dependent methyltransferase